MIYIDSAKTAWFIIKQAHVSRLFKSATLPINVIYEDGTSLEIQTEAELCKALNEGRMFGISLGNANHLFNRIAKDMRIK